MNEYDWYVVIVDQIDFYVGFIIMRYLDVNECLLCFFTRATKLLNMISILWWRCSDTVWDLGSRTILMVFY